jgi:type III secretion protein U
MSEKRHDPTPARLREARRKGQIPTSRMLSSAAVTFGGVVGLISTWRFTSARLQDWTVSLFTLADCEPITALNTALELLALGSAPAVLGAFSASLVVSVGVAGFHFQPGLAAPDFERVNLGAGLKKLVNARQFIDLAKSLCLASILLLLMFDEMNGYGSDALRLVEQDGLRSMTAFLGMLIPATAKVACVALLLGLADYALARRRHHRDLMMTHEEVKQEYKNSEGDAHHKSQRKALHRQIAAGGPARGVQKATAVVVNPTHLAIALRYDTSETDAPYIVAKGREADALSIRTEAQRLGISVVRDIPLARSLIHFDVGEEIPEELYQAAAAILKVALEQSRHRDLHHQTRTP